MMATSTSSQSECDSFFDHAISLLQYSARIEGEADDRTTDYIVEQLEALLRRSNRFLYGFLLPHLSDSSLSTTDASHVAQAIIAMSHLHVRNSQMYVRILERTFEILRCTFEILERTFEILRCTFESSNVRLKFSDVRSNPRTYV